MLYKLRGTRFEQGQTLHQAGADRSVCPIFNSPIPSARICRALPASSGSAFRGRPMAFLPLAGPFARTCSRPALTRSEIVACGNGRLQLFNPERTRQDQFRFFIFGEMVGLEQPGLASALVREVRPQACGARPASFAEFCSSRRPALLPRLCPCPCAGPI